MARVVIKSKYDWKKTLAKFGWQALYVFLTGLLVLWQEDPRYMVLIPFLAAAHNWLKNR